MSETEEQDLPFERSSIAAIGARRRWRLFGWHSEDETPAYSPNGDSPDHDGGPPGRNMLGLGSFSDLPIATASKDRPPPARREAPEDAPVPDEGPPVPSMLGSLADRADFLQPGPEDDRPATMLALGDASAPQPDEPEAFGHLTQYSTIAELAGLEEHVANEWPIERGVLISLLFHISLMLMLIILPTRLPGGRSGDLFAMLEPPPKTDDGPIPVILDAPGMPRPNPKPAPLSDADRRAGGGDRSKPKAQTPYVPPSSGIAGLAPGPRAPRLPGGPPSPRAVPRGERGTVPSRAGEPQIAEQQKTDQKTSENPNQMPAPPRGQPTGPREIGKLAGLDRAIQEAARSAVASQGGEGGAPQGNPDGGYVDSGPLSFDTKWYDWGAYAAEMVRRIKLHWDVPELARLGWKGSLTVRFHILADGRVADAKIIRYSGIPPFDNAALQAILKSSPFRPLPEELHEEREGVTVTFLYNMRLEEEGRQQ